MNAETIEQAIRESIKGALVARRLTVCGLAKQSGIARSTLNHWIKGERRIGSDALCQVFSTIGANVVICI